jgi:ribonuclease G
MKKILITARPWETRIAIVENKQLQNIYFDSKHNFQLEKSFIKGKVVKILPGVQTAFVDIGQEKAGFLHISEIDRTFTREKAVSGREDDTLADLEDIAEEAEIKLDRNYTRNVNISDILKEGESLLVQVSKEPINAKGPKLTTCFSLPGRFVILMPNIPKIGISKKIIDFDERKRLKDIILSVLPEESGCIIRTTSEGKADSEILADLHYLLGVWNDIKNKYNQVENFTCIYKDIDLAYQIVRDNLDESIEQIISDNPDLHKHLDRFINSISSGFRSKNFLYTGEAPLFDHYELEKAIQKGLESKVELECGGSIVIESTEAMTVIDVNTARFTGSGNLEETLLKTNLEAAKSVVRQLKLRNIGGLIVIDFIDMNSHVNRNKLFSFFEKTLKEEDRFQSVLLKISEFGLVQMTRKRTGKTLRHQLTKDCTHCNGTGMMKSIEERVHELLRSLEKEAKMKNGNKVNFYLCHVYLNELLGKYLLNVQFDALLFFEKMYNIKIVVNEDPGIRVEAYYFEWVLKKEI